MARPLKQGIDYFPHDVDAINDRKIQLLVLKHGIAGYGFYFALLSEIYSNLPEPYIWNVNRERFNYVYHIKSDYSERVIVTLLECSLLDRSKYDSDNVLISSSITERADTILKARLNKRNQRQTEDIQQDKPSTNAGKHNNKSIIIKHNNNIYTYWNDKHIIIHEKLTDKIDARINTALNTYSEDIIKQAIDNYATVLNDPGSYFKHKWTLLDFLQRGIEKFLTSADPLTNFKKDEQEGKNGTNQHDTTKYPVTQRKQYTESPDYGGDSDRRDSGGTA